MNVFELATLTSPFAGLVAGLLCSRGQSVGQTALSAVAGLAVGLAVYPGVVILLSKTLDGKIKLAAEKPTRMAWLIGTGMVGYAMVAPFVAWLVATKAIPWLMHALA